LPDTGYQDSWVVKVDSLGCPILNCLTSILDENVSENNFVKFANPVINTLTIEFETLFKGNILIVDYMGRTIYSKYSYASRIEIDLSLQPSGIYNILFEGNNKQVTKKMILFKL
jgi:hypothetical protein